MIWLIIVSHSAIDIRSTLDEVLPKMFGRDVEIHGETDEEEHDQRSRFGRGYFRGLDPARCASPPTVLLCPPLFARIARPPSVSRPQKEQKKRLGTF